MPKESWNEYLKIVGIKQISLYEHMLVIYKLLVNMIILSCGCILIIQTNPKRMFLIQTT